MSNRTTPDINKFPLTKIRNFSIIAHIDHGKSTLADRLLEITGTISTRQKNTQVLDKLQVERERGITVKAQTASLIYTYKGEDYLLNLIDTPGHVDFNYEVSRSLYACQGAVLLVDASQGIQAQTMANFYLAFEQNLTIIPVVNKIDIAAARPEQTALEMVNELGVNQEEIIFLSAKSGIGVNELLNAVIEKIPCPTGSQDEPLTILLFDSWFDIYRGVICLIEIIDGKLKKGDHITSAHTGESYEVLDIGLMYPDPETTGALMTGQVGYLIAGMKTVREAHIGDTLYKKQHPVTPLPGFKPSKPVVFAGLYPIDTNDYNDLKDAIDKLTLNDPSVHVQKESSVALGFGFRCGFLGLLHMDVFKQRLEQEYKITVIATAPTVGYRVTLQTGETKIIENPVEFPEPNKILITEEPIVKATIITPKAYLGAIISLCEQARGEQKDMRYLDENRVMIKYELPLAEIVTDFYDELKSVSAGYATFDYEVGAYNETDIVKLDLLLNGKAVDAFSLIVHEKKAYRVGRSIAEKLRETIHRQMFEITIQAAIGAKIIARERIAAFRKDVTQHMYGGDVTRKMKLLDKQKEGKKAMKQVGTVELPQEAFLSILKR